MRVNIIILDGVGVGSLPDAKSYNDEGSNTIGNLAKKVGGLSLPNLQKLGLGNIIEIKGIPPASTPVASYAKLAEVSYGKDSTSGHWELCGVILNRPFPVYSKFPPEIISKFEKKIKRKTIGNLRASGTEIIKELGEEHIKTGYPIVYTSADSVFQLAAHEDIIPVNQLYDYCLIARETLKGKWSVARVIARPFTGEVGDFKRTERRKDFSLPPPSATLLDVLNRAKVPVIGLGKIDDIFANRGLTESYHTVDNLKCMDYIIEMMDRLKSGLVISNLVEFDMVWGHRNNSNGFYKGLKDFDNWLAKLETKIEEEDIVIITADHGCDPTTPSTDHSREYAPLLMFGEKVSEGVNLGIRNSFADVGKTVGEIFRVKNNLCGESFLCKIWKN